MKTALIFGSIYCLTAVILGAYATHGLSKILSEYYLTVFEIGVKFQFYHGLGLLVVAFIHDRIRTNLSLSAIILLSLGTCVFSGSLYLLSFYKVSWLGPITPIGGSFLIFGWLCLLIAIIKCDFSPTFKS